MQILIIGKTASSITLAKRIKKINMEAIVFIAPGNQAVCDCATCVDIQVDNVEELIDFAQANEIDLTIVCDDEALESEVVEAFNEAGLMIFGPEKESSRFALSKAVGKRFMYKLGIPTPKFGIFDKENVAREYVKNASYPILIKSDRHVAGERVFLCLSEREANKILNKFFAIESPKVVIENYVAGREFSFYVLTDGYNALPICSVVPYKYAAEKDGGSITKGVGAYAPATFVDEDLTMKILDMVIYPVLNEIERSSSPYVGVLGVDLILDADNEINVIEFNTFFNEPDIECVLELLNDDVISLFKACCVGSLADDYDYIDTKNGSAFASVLFRTGEYLFDESLVAISGIDDLDDDVDVTFYNTVNKNGEVKAKSGRILSLTTLSSTLNRSKKNILQYIECVDFKGKKFRKDILESVNER